jgi:hypothetical protein
MIATIITLLVIFWLVCYVGTVRLFLYAFKYDWPSLTMSVADMLFVLIFGFFAAPVTASVWTLLSCDKTRSMAWTGRMPKSRREQHVRASMESILNRVFRIN